MKTIYFVRHGESEGNVSNRWQDGTASLTKTGHEQSALLGERFARIPVDMLISSNMKRALQTANIVSNKINVPITHSDIFNERRRPSEQLGKKKDSEQALEAGVAIKEHFDDPGFRYSDEENFDDLKGRAIEIFSYLEGLKKKHIVVITHEILMRILVAYITHGSELTAEEGKQFFRTFHMNNAGITIIARNEGDNKSTWDLLTWNDYSHLLDMSVTYE